MNRRQFVSLFASGVMALPFSAHAQRPEKMPVIGVLWHAANAEEEAPFRGPLREGFTNLGYVEGRISSLRNATLTNNLSDFTASWPTWCASRSMCWFPCPICRPWPLNARLDHSDCVLSMYGSSLPQIGRQPRAARREYHRSILHDGRHHCETHAHTQGGSANSLPRCPAREPAQCK